MTPDFSYQFYRTTEQALEAMYQALLGARKSIYWEIYSLIDDSSGNRFINVLCDKAKAGLEVKLIIDAMGSFEMSRHSLARLRATGADVTVYNPVWGGEGNWFRRLWMRNHRKVLVIDEETAFVGGVNVGAIYHEWDDLFLRFTGQLVWPLLRGFAKTYIRCGGKRSRVKHLLRPKWQDDWRELTDKIKFILHSPVRFGQSPVRRMYLDGLDTAQTNFNLLTPYFVPDKKFFSSISEAHKRGVAVKLFFPLRPDWKFLEWVGHFYYRWAQKSGASVFLSRRMNHGKAMTTDQRRGYVGSANLTYRSFYYNEEAGVSFEDEEMVRELNLIFNDLEQTGLKLEETKFGRAHWLNRIRAWVGEKLGRIV